MENVIRDYQTRIYVSKYDKMFSYKSPFRNDEFLKKFYDKFMPSDYKTPFFISNSKNNLGKTFRESPEKLEKMKRDNARNLQKSRPKSTNQLINIMQNDNTKNLSISPEDKKNINYSLNKYFTLNGINFKKKNSKNI